MSAAGGGVVSGPCPAKPEQSVVFRVGLYRVEYDVLAGVTVYVEATGGKVAWFCYAPDAAVWLMADIHDGRAAVDPLSEFRAHEAAWTAGMNARLAWFDASRMSRTAAQLAQTCAWCATPPSRVVSVGNSARWEPACSPCRAAYVRGELPLPDDAPEKPSAVLGSVVGELADLGRGVGFRLSLRRPVSPQVAAELARGDGGVVDSSP